MDFPSFKRKEINRGSNLEDKNSRFVPPDLRKAVFERDQCKCVNCTSELYPEIDHAVPIAMGGTSELNNLQVLCRKCNSNKRDRQWWGVSLRHVAIEKLGSVENLTLLYERTGVERSMKG